MIGSLLTTIEQQRETVISLQRMLVTTPALGPDNGGDGERLKADKLKAFFAEHGLTGFTEYNAPDPRVSCGHRPNMKLIIEGQDASRTFWIIAHMDVVPAGDIALWETNPFELAVKDDELRGRGVEDNHQGLVSAFLLAKALKDTNTKPPINLGLFFISDEETGNALGLEYLTKNHRDLFKDSDLFLVPDSGIPTSEQVEVAEKSILWLKVIVKGKQCHAAMPEKGVNALTAAAAFILKAKEIEKRFDNENPLFNPPCSTITPTKIGANVPNINTISGHDVFHFDCRILPHYKVDDVLAAIKETGKTIEASYGVTIEYEIVQRNDAAPITPEDSEVVHRFIKAIQAECPTAHPRAQGVGGGTAAAFLRRVGLNVVVWSTLIHNPHVPNERSSIAFTLRDAKIMARVLFNAYA